MEGWMKWGKENEASIVDPGSPLVRPSVQTQRAFRIPKMRSRDIRLSRPNHRKLLLPCLQIIRIS